MMGVQATAGKRKLETAATAGDSCPVKTGRWEPAGTDDCIARLQAVAVPGDAWRPTPTPTPTPILSSTLLSSDDFDDDDDFEDELSDDDRCSGAGIPDPLRYGAQPPYQPRYQNHQPVDGDYHQHGQPGGQPRPGPGYWNYYSPPAQQTIRCDENGKSYLELGSAPPARTRCCDGRTRWCNVPCYRQRRLAVLNLSMCKLARYRQCSDPSLRRSVLICNTLRHIEREMESEGNQQPCAPPPPPEPCYSPFPDCPPPSRPAPVPVSNMSEPQPVAVTPHYEHNLREFATPSGRITPFPASNSATDADSGIGDDDAGRGINWGSVLSLTSQTDLEPLNNNELYAELGLAEPLAQEWKEPARVDGEWDSFMHVLVGGT